MIRRFRRHRTTLGVVWVIILFLIAFAYAMFQGGFVSWFVFYSFVPIMLYTMSLVFYSLNDMKIERLIEKDELYADEPLQATIKLTRRIPFPLFYLVIEDHTPENMLKRHGKIKKEATKGLLSLGFQKTITFKYTINGMPRGEYRFQKVTVKTGDVFGFVQKEKTFKVEQNVLVYPKIISMRKWLPLDLSMGGRHRSKKQFEIDLTSISSIRDYIPGDRLSWLDWKATARVNKLVTKQFEFPLNKDIVVIFDRTTGNLQNQKVEDFERAVSLAASISDRALLTGSSVGFGSLGKDTTWVSMHDQAYQKWVILHHLASAEQDGLMDASYAFHKYVKQLSQQTTIVYITTQVNERSILLFNDLISRGLTVELFYCVDEPSERDHHLLQKFRAMSVYVHIIKDGHFDDILKAGEARVTI